MNTLDPATFSLLRQPFKPEHVTWKPGAVKGERALALAYGDLRAYMNRLDEVCGPDWSVEYMPWGNDRIICNLTIMGVTRSSTGESTNEAERGEIGGTVAEAQAFKRASAMFGLGRYLYNLPSVWVDYDPATKQFTDKAKAKLLGLLSSHYNRTLADAVGGITVEEAEPLSFDEERQERKAAEGAKLYDLEVVKARCHALQHAAGEKPATEKMLGRLEEAVKELVGDAWMPALLELSGASKVADLSMSLVNELNGKLYKDKWDTKEKRYVPNDGIDQRLQDSIKQWFDL